MTMKKTLTLFALLTLCLGLFAGNIWTVKSVPNTRLEGNQIHVSDPDGILSDSCEQMINTSLHAIRDQVDVFVVALNSIGDADIDVFANELFNYWGIGDSEKDNGVLILLAKEQRQLKFETGYGAESTLTDAKCQRIFEDDIVPFFKEGDYEGGLCTGVTQVLSVYGGEIPDGLITQLPEHYESRDDEMSASLIILILVAGIFLILLPFIALVVYLAYDRKVQRVSSFVDNSTVIDGVRYINISGKPWDGNPWGGVGCMKALMYGLSIFLFVFLGYFIEAARVGVGGEVNHWLAVLYGFILYLTWICMRQNGRALRAADKLARVSINPKEIYTVANNNGLTRLTRWLALWIGWIYALIFKHKINRSNESRCIDCGRAMNRFSKFRFSPVQQKEMELKAVEYTPYICELGHVTIMKEVKDANYHRCMICQGITEHKINSKVIEPATYSKSGRMEVTYRCEYCGGIRMEEELIPMMVQAMHGSSGGGHSSGSSHSSSHHYHSSGSHGSFGGGHSGGGGYRGSW